MTTSAQLFGQSQVDGYSICKELTTRIKFSTLNEKTKRVTVSESIFHTRQTNTFYDTLQEVSQICKSISDVVAITLDYRTNLPLSFMLVREIFYITMLWLYEFNIRDIWNIKICILHIH